MAAVGTLARATPDLDHLNVPAAAPILLFAGANGALHPPGVARAESRVLGGRQSAQSSETFVGVSVASCASRRRLGARSPGQTLKTPMPHATALPSAPAGALPSTISRE